MKTINLETWPRRKHFELYQHMDYPHYNVTTRIDVTHFYKYTRENNIPFYKGMIYAVCKHLNRIENFRYRIRDNSVVLHDVIHPSFTILLKDDLYSNCHGTYNENPFVFFKDVQKTIDDMGDEPNLENAPSGDDRIYITSLPWIDFTSIVHPSHMNPVDSVPRVAWGRFVREHDKYMMAMSLQAHHGLADGIHVASFFEYLQRDLWTPDDLF